MLIVSVCVQDEDLDFTLTTDFEIGHFFRERVIPKAVLYFTGEALEDDESVRLLFLLLLSQGNLGLTIDSTTKIITWMLYIGLNCNTISFCVKTPGTGHFLVDFHNFK